MVLTSALTAAIIAWANTNGYDVLSINDAKQDASEIAVRYIKQSP